MIDKVREFCVENKIFGHMKVIQDPIEYYSYFISINDITRKPKMRASETEKWLLAHIIHFIMENGEIKSNKKSFDRLMAFLFERGVVANKNLYLAHKNNLGEKGYVKKNSTKYCLALEDKFKEVVSHDQINIFISKGKDVR